MGSTDQKDLMYSQPSLNNVACDIPVGLPLNMLPNGMRHRLPPVAMAKYCYAAPTLLLHKLIVGTTWCANVVVPIADEIPLRSAKVIGMGSFLTETKTLPPFPWQ